MPWQVVGEVKGACSVGAGGVKGEVTRSNTLA